MQSVHGEGVLGERVEVSFDEGDWYLGTIEEMKTSLNDGALAYKHFVRFDDGDKKWLDLAEEEKLKQLRWPSKVGAKRVSDPVGPPLSPVKKSSKAPAGTPEHKPVHAKMAKPTQASSPKAPMPAPMPVPEPKLAPIVRVPEPKLAAPIVRVPEPKLAPPLVSESKSLAPGPVERDMPDSVDAIIHYMDRIEPGKGYFQKQVDNRDGCSKTRKKLRTFADKNPTHPGVAFWVNTSKWAPPNQTALDACVVLLKTMIK